MTDHAPHIVCFNPYPRWSLHSARQATILHGLKVRGCTTLYVLCDGAMSECDMFQPAKGPGYVRNTMSCTLCQAGSAATLNKLATSYRWLGRWLPTNAETDASLWAESISSETLAHAVYEDWAIGDWVRSSVHSHFRASELNFDDPEVATTYRRYIASGLVVAWGVQSLFDYEKPDIQLLFNGRMAPTRIALELAKLNGIRTVSEERGFAPNHLRLVEDTHCLDPIPFYDLWDRWKNVPLSSKEIELVGNLLAQHKEGTGFDIPLFAAPVSGPEAIVADIGLDPARPIITVFTSATDEAARQPEADGILPNQADWLKRTVEIARNKPHVQFVIRAHPNTAGKRALGTNADDLSLIENLSAGAPANVTVIAPDADISSFDLIAASDFGLVWHSTVGLEMAALGKPVLRAGAYWFRDASFMHTPKNAEDYEDAVTRLLDSSETDNSTARVIEAWRFAACWFYRQGFQFPLVQQPDWARGEFSFESADALMPGQDQSLDSICAIIMNSNPIYPNPRPESAGNADAEKMAIMKWLSE